MAAPIILSRSTASLSFRMPKARLHALAASIVLAARWVIGDCSLFAQPAAAPTEDLAVPPASVAPAARLDPAEAAAAASEATEIRA